MTAASLVERVAALIEGTLQVDVPAADLDLVDAGLIDSLGLLNLITEIERNFGIQLPLDDLDVERFKTAEQIAAYVETCGGRA